MLIPVTDRYLWLPVQNGAPLQRVEIKSGDSKLFDIQIEAGVLPDFYSVLDLKPWLGQTLELSGDCPADWFTQVVCHDGWPDSTDARRPLLHFSTRIGWINDPNGLIYKDGQWHLYYQHNPFGIGWENMHWGHAVSTDLIHWQHTEEALYPDEHGVAFSGCAIEDRDNVAGFGAGTIIYYYTACTACKTWFSDEPTTQRLVISRDGGQTLEKRDEGFVGHIQGLNRDPKIFRYQGLYYMLLYLDETTFTLLKSANLLEWQRIQTWDLPKAWECPDLVNLPIRSAGGQLTGENQWVFYSADGFYFLSDFDGEKFSTNGILREAYTTKLPYAGQRFAGVEDRVILQNWLRTPNTGACYTGLMAIPAELELVRIDDQLKLRIWPVAEYEALRGESIILQPVGAASDRSGSLPAQLDGRPAELLLQFDPESRGQAALVILGQTFQIDCDQKQFAFGEDRAQYLGLDGLQIRLFVDYRAVECYLDNGLTYFACAWDIQSLVGDLTVKLPETARLTCCEGYYLKV